MFSDIFALVVYAVSVGRCVCGRMVDVERGAWSVVGGYVKIFFYLVPSLPSLPKVLTGMSTTVPMVVILLSHLLETP